MWLPFLALDSYIALEYGDAMPPLVNGHGPHGLVVDPHRGVVEDVEDQYCVRCYLEFKVAPVCNIGMNHGPLLNPNRPFAKPKNIDSLNGFGIYRLLDEDTSRIQVFLIPARANQLNRRKPGKSALLNHSFEVIEERRGIFREHLLEMILTYPGRMSLPRQCFDNVHNRSKYTQKKSVNQITGSYGGTERLFVGDIALTPAAPETFNLGGEVHDGDLLMIVYDFISSDHTMVGPKAGRSIIWTATSGTYDVTVEAFDYSSATGGVSRISGFNLMLSASGTILSMEATGEVDTIIEAFHVVGIYRLSKAL